MKRMVFGFVVVVVLLTSSQAAAQELYFDLRTNYTPSEVGWVRVELIDRADERRTWTNLQQARGDFTRGIRIAELDGVSRGEYTLFVELLDGLMRTVHGRVWLFTMPNTVRHASTLLITRP